MLIADTRAEVRIAAGETLVVVAGLVRKEDLGTRVLTIVLELAHNEVNEDLRMTAVRDGACPCARRARARCMLTRMRRTHRACPPPPLQAVLLNELAETLGPDLCRDFVTPELICLAEDPMFRVRKVRTVTSTECALACARVRSRGGLHRPRLVCPVLYAPSCMPLGHAGGRVEH
ncbi:hypothetical protein EON68_00730 [archaeon]|nr:MAG: hypothetical protein EON68_00730 [archaeon]